MLDFSESVSRAREAGACEDAMADIEAMAGWDEFFAHPLAPQWAVWYAHRVLRGRWPEAEPTIAKDTFYAYSYAADVVRARWPEAEQVIAQTPYWAYRYAVDVIDGRWPEAEPVIAQSPEWAYRYAHRVMRGRWPEAEPIIAQAAKWAYCYAHDVIGGLWPEAEPTISQDPYWACLYARYVLRAPWPEAEPAIALDQLSASLYRQQQQMSQSLIDQGQAGTDPTAQLLDAVIAGLRRIGSVRAIRISAAPSRYPRPVFRASEYMIYLNHRGKPAMRHMGYLSPRCAESKARLVMRAAAGAAGLFVLPEALRRIPDWRARDLSRLVAYIDRRLAGHDESMRPAMETLTKSRKEDDE